MVAGLLRCLQHFRENHTFFVQILVISAHLKRSDVELWAKAGQLAVELGNLSLASRCYQQGLSVQEEGGREGGRRITAYVLICIA